MEKTPIESGIHDILYVFIDGVRPVSTYFVLSTIIIV